MTLTDSIKRIPPITRFIIVVSTLICLLSLLGLYDASNLLLDVNLTGDLRSIAKYITHSYKLITTFLVPKELFGMERIKVVFDLYFFYDFSSQLEVTKFRSNSIDYLWFIILTGFISLIITSFVNLLDVRYFPFYFDILFSCVVYMWSRIQKNSTVKYFGIIPIKTYYLPLANTLVKFIISGPFSIFDIIIGILGGYIYQCIQSNTLPVYNLFPSAYKTTKRDRQAQRLGDNVIDVSSMAADGDMIQDSVFDKGYLKAPTWLYKLLNYVIRNSNRIAGFDGTPHKRQTKAEKTSSVFTGSAFKGKGHRLGN